MSPPIRPLVTQPRIVPALWGGTRLASWLRLPTPWPERIAEVWLVYDDNEIRNSSFAGRSLAEVSREMGEALLGHRSFARYGADFPLLAKFLDTAAPLSVQVHPDDGYAHTHESSTGYHGKNEAWYVIDAAPGSTVALGLDREVVRDEFTAAVEDGSLDGLLRRIPVIAGQTVLVPAGTIHTIGPGILLYEIQQKSDLTYRVYDFGRRDPSTGQPRELHLAKALDVAHLGPAVASPGPTQLSAGRQLLATCPSFALERWTIAETVVASTDPGSVEILTIVEGEAVLGSPGSEMPLARGTAVVLPAALGEYRVGAEPGGAVLLRAYVPE